LQKGVLKLLLAEECQDANKAFQQISIENRGREVLELLALVEKYIDQDSMVPKISQGIKIERQETAYEASQRLSQAGKYMGSVIRNGDEGLIEPIVTDFYKYNMEDPAVRRGKGNFVVKALGFSSFQDRIVRATKIQQLLTLLLSSPLLQADWKIGKLGDELAKSYDIDPDEFKKTAEEKQAEAQMRAEAEQAAAAMQQEAAAAEVGKTQAQAEAIRTKAVTDAAKVELEAEKAEAQMAPTGL